MNGSDDIISTRAVLCNSKMGNPVKPLNITLKHKVNVCCMCKNFKL